MEALASTQRLGYRPGLDGLRAVAIAGVVLIHAYRRPSTGLYGVDVFFVLSGFLITTLLLEERQLTGTLRLGRFYMRRARRLVPALVVMTATVVVVAGVAGENIRFLAWSAVFGVSYVMNIALAFFGSDAAQFDLHPLWSLATEEQFYLLWPAAIIAVSGRRGLLLGLSAVGAAVSLAQGAHLALSHASLDRVMFGPDVRGLGALMVGCFLAALPAHPAVRRLGRILGPAAFVALAVVLMSSLAITPTRVIALSWIVAILTAGTIAGVVHRASVVTWVLELPPLVYLGRISYSLYLWHIPVLVVFGVARGEPRPLTATAAIAAAIGVAAISHHVVESRFRRHRASLRSDHQLSHEGPLRIQAPG